MKKFRLAVAMVAVLGMSGCATIVSDSSYSVKIESTPLNSHFEILDARDKTIHSGITPKTVMLKAGDGYFTKAQYTLNFKSDGYVFKSVKLTPTLDNWYIGNLLFGGLIGWLIIDPMSGAMYTLPESVSVVLDKTEKDTAQLNVMTIDSLPDAYHGSLIALAN